MDHAPGSYSTEQPGISGLDSQKKAKFQASKPAKPRRLDAADLLKVDGLQKPGNLDPPNHLNPKSPIPSFLPDIPIPSWVRSLELERYTENLKDLSYGEFLELDDRALKLRGVNPVELRGQMSLFDKQIEGNSSHLCVSYCDRLTLAAEEDKGNYNSTGYPDEAITSNNWGYQSSKVIAPILRSNNEVGDRRHSNNPW
jgi:hypothetical protein